MPKGFPSAGRSSARPVAGDEQKNRGEDAQGPHNWGLSANGDDGGASGHGPTRKGRGEECGDPGSRLETWR